MINVYITNLGKYNEGCLVGKWLKLPATDEEIEEVLKEIGFYMKNISLLIGSV